MYRLFSSPILLTVIALSIVSTPVTYRGGSAAPHPHMFLQLWEDAATGSFTHHAHVTDYSSRSTSVPHHHHHPSPKLDLEPIEDVKGPVATVFVVSDWGVQALLGQLIESLEEDTGSLPRRFAETNSLHGVSPMPDIPPPRRPCNR